MTGIAVLTYVAVGFVVGVVVGVFIGVAAAVANVEMRVAWQEHRKQVEARSEIKKAFANLNALLKSKGEPK